MPRKNNQAPGLGKSLIKDRFGKKRNNAHLHAAELAAEHEDGEINLKSVTELNSLDDFLATAELAGTEFTAQKLNIHFVSSEKKGIIAEEEQERLEQAHRDFQHLLGIPRRPKWDKNTSKEELDAKERESFLAWRRQLATLQEENDVLITPYEKNLDFWRQLWRVIERSDVIVQIVDARDPLLYRCKDLETYVKQVDPRKQNVILVNKSDLLSFNQRQAWQKYFNEINIPAVFWSAVLENEKLELKNEINKDEIIEDVVDESDDDSVSDHSSEEDADADADANAKNVIEKEVVSNEVVQEEEKNLDGCLLDRNELIQFFKSIVVDKESKVIGMVGYPNVGKSSTVNTLMGVKKAAVSATPGRTKHFQTLHVDETLCLCDCPGLVFPSFVSSKAQMVLSGILPIDQMRDHVGPMNLLCYRVTRSVIEGTYGINILKPREGEDPDRPPTSAEMLNAHALSRGFMTSHGQPDNARSARIVLKDYVNGKLLFTEPPPGCDAQEYESWTVSKVSIALSAMANSLSISEDLVTHVARINRVNKKIVDEANKVEEEFFNPHYVGTCMNSARNVPQKTGKKHRKGKKEKARRIRRG